MATLLLKKSYQHKSLKEVKFKDLWNQHGVFTTMRLIGKPTKILFFDEHIRNLIQSLNIYKIKTKNLKRNIIKLINLNLKNHNYSDHLLRVAVNKKIISISIRKRPIPNKHFDLKLINYQRIDPTHKNLKYKKILSLIRKIDVKKMDIALYKNNKFLETGTSNLLFVKKNKFYSPKNNFYNGTTLKFLNKKLKKINKVDISLDSLKSYDEIIVVGSGKGITSVNSIKNTTWKRKSLNNYRILNKIYQKAVKNCPIYKS